jgi:hypothetical protein
MPLYPKGSAPGKHREKVAIQPSARFIQLAFKMIDPTIPFETVMTAARNAFDARSQLARNVGADHNTKNDPLEHYAKNQSHGVIDAAKVATIFHLRMAADLIHVKHAAERASLDDHVEFARRVINLKRE